MHLLNSKTRKLETFIGREVPPYAILSHTWGHDEVTFKDLTTSSSDVFSIERMLGYFKVQKSCEQALQNGLGYVWVDTCCIDKSSSAELSEAINSMFSWYQGAKICYVYLSDVAVFANRSYYLDKDPIPNEGILKNGRIRCLCENRGRYDLEVDLMATDCKELLSKECPDFFNSRWFSRGWTLQELVSPPQLMFFGIGWKVIGDRESFAKAIEAITNISPSVLGSPWNLGRFSIAERMSWAAHRQTTRIEDEAYSLLGMFGINIPLLYGEGQRAFVRLQEAIMSRSSDQTIFAWGGGRFDPLDHTTALNFSYTDLALDRDPRNTGSTILAPSVAFFMNSSKIRSLGNLESTPFAFTNSGLQITLPIVSVGTTEYRGECIDIFGAILNCRIDGGWIALPLYKVDRSSNVYCVLKLAQQRMIYIDALVARSAKVVPLTIKEFEFPYGLDASGPHSEVSRFKEPLQLAFLIDEQQLRDFDLSIHNMFPGANWRSFYDFRGSGGCRLRSAQFSGQGAMGLGLACGTILLTRKGSAGAKVLVSFRYGTDQISQSVVRLHYWPDSKSPRQECRCYLRPCRHRLNAAPCEKSLAKGSSSLIEEVASNTSSDRLMSSKDMIVLWPGNLKIGASLREEVVLGLKHMLLELEVSSESS